MLTKDHIKARVRATRVLPEFIATDDAAVFALARDVCDGFQQVCGKTLAAMATDLEDALSAPKGSAFFKLLSDRCQFEGFSESIEEDRWDLFAKSKELRQRPEMDIRSFRAEMETNSGRSFQDLSEMIYADLPDLKVVRSVKTLTPEQLVNRYNVGQVQGLLLKAHEVIITIDSVATKPEALRYLFHQIKFHKLLASVSDDAKKKRFVVSISGPMALFDQASSYGLQLAMFFPSVLALPNFLVEAEVEHKKGKTHLLKIDQKSGLTPLSSRGFGYIPPETTAFIEGFNECQKAYSAERGGVPINLGKGQYIIPDFTLTRRKDGEIFHVELFHKWHASQLLARLDHLGTSKNQNVLLGVTRSLAKKSEVEKQLKESCWFDKKGFLFGDFPTSKALVSLLERNCRNT